MTKRVTVSETNSPSPDFAESFARLLLERESAPPALTVEAERQTMTADRQEVATVSLLPRMTKGNL